VRAFEDANVPHPEDTVNPLRDIETINLEFTFSDLGIIEKRLRRIRDTIAKTRGPEREANEREAVVLQRLQTELEAGTPIRAVALTEDEQRILRGFGFLTAKPLLILLNLGEDQLGAAGDALVAQAREQFGGPQIAIDALAGKIEMEISRLEPEDALVFMDDLGIPESSLGRTIRLSFDLLGLMPFFTVGPDECRAWTVPRGVIAVDAAGEIHSDIQRGFIRAEVVSYDDLITTGGLSEAKKAGKFRREGRDYIFQDGDVVNFLFNV